MQTHRVVHDFGELSREDFEHLSYIAPPKNIIQENPFTFLVAALAVGILLGLLTHRKSASSSSL